MQQPVNFQVNGDLCTRCGLCAKDCPAFIIAAPTNGNPPCIAEDAEQKCYRCQHCLAICPVGAISVVGQDPTASTPLGRDAYPSPDQLETLMRGRRSTRHYQDKNVAPETIARLLDVASAAPSGRNQRTLRITLIDDISKLADFREKIISAIEERVSSGTLPPNRQYFVGIAKAWRERKQDVLFRGAPHFITVSTPTVAACPMQDSVIWLSYFELFAHANGLATLWDGMVYWVLTEIVPEAQEWLGIPADHTVGYCMLFGHARNRYARTVGHPCHTVDVL